MKYVIKVGSLYVTADGTLSPNQGDALVLFDLPVENRLDRIGFVKLVPRGSSASSSV